MRIKALAAGLLLSWASASFAQGAPTQAPQYKFELHGFTSGTLYMQDQNMGPGGGGISLFNNAQTLTQRAPNQDRLVLGGDVRQTRFNFSITGPAVLGGAIPKGVLEIDFYGGDGAGAYGDVSLTPRMRLAYGELNWGAHRIQVGQNNDLVIGMIPVSLAHIAFPVTYGAGTIGWRRPGLWGYHTFGDVANKDATKLQFDWNVGRSQWLDSGANVAAGIGNGMGQHIMGPNGGGDIYGFQAGEASGLPAVSARLTVLGGQAYSVWVTGFYEKIDRSGVGAGPTTTPAGISSDMDLIAGVIGAKGTIGPLSLAATGYTGKNTGPLVGNFLQFQPNTAGDVHDMGGWIQAGFNFTKELSFWYLVGAEMPNRQEAKDAGFTRLGQVTNSALLQYRDGGWAFGLEWVHFHTTTVVPASTATVSTAGWDSAIDGNQFMVSGNYFF